MSGRDYTARMPRNDDSEPAPACTRVPSTRAREQRIIGLNAVRAAFTRRPQDLRKLWLTAARQRELRDVLAWCVKQRIGYRIVAADEVERIAASSHHEGVCAAFLQPPPLTLADLLAAQPAGPALLLWLEGVGNPHNLGAILRSGAHFGAGAALVAAGTGAQLSAAAMRVSEGGAEAVPLVVVNDRAQAFAALHGAGFAIAASTPRAALDLYAAALPARLLLALGAEGGGLDADFVAAADLRLRIPGSGAVESLNVAAAAAVLAGEWFRRHANAAAG